MDADAKLNQAQIRELVTRGAKLHRECSSLEKKSNELDLIKAKLRALANGRDATFNGSGGAVAIVEQKPGFCRVVPSDSVPKALKLAGEFLSSLFTFHPSKGAEKSFELNARKVLPKGKAQQ